MTMSIVYSIVWFSLSAISASARRILGRNRHGHTLIDGDEFALGVAGIDLARARNLLFRVDHEFFPLRKPSRGARNRKQHGEHFGAEAHRLVHDPRVKIDVGIEFAFDEIFVFERYAFQFKRNVEFWV